MVSKASDDFPDPDRPVRTIRRLRGSTRSMCLRLCSAAPLMTMESTDMPLLGAFRAVDARLVEPAILGHVLPAVNAGEQAELVHLDAGNIDTLRADFNAAGGTRMVLLLSPT